VIGAVLAHGSGLDELAIFVFPVVMGLGFWLITRQKAKGGDEAEADEASTPPVATIASELPNAPKPVNGRHVSPFHSMIQMPDVRVPADDDAPDQSAATTTPV
jgi:hypothetical protein